MVKFCEAIMMQSSSVSRKYPKVIKAHTIA